uniref:Uncharacterized protein n=1 Tax=Anguilla anguilla TaxID=7936 RepID=A0A0E9UTP3_ANGAN
MVQPLLRVVFVQRLIVLRDLSSDRSNPGRASIYELTSSPVRKDRNEGGPILKASPTSTC